MITTLGELRHECLRCGGICQGSMVRVEEDERELVEAGAVAVGVSEPIVDGHLRKQAGRCCFLGEDNGCLLHARFGARGKPRVCRQFPIVAVRVGDEVRVAVDPGCLRTYATWRGPVVEPESLMATRNELPESILGVESAVLDLADPETRRLGHLLHALCGEASVGGAPPEGFARRWATHLRRSPLAARIRHPDTAPPIRECLAHVAGLLDELDADALPAWSLGDDEDAFAVDVVQRMVFLRTIPYFGLPQATAVLVAGGAVLCAWADPSPERFGPALSAWCRALRVEAVARDLLPDGATLAWLARGEGPA
ncbi:MAG: YkgJ family cysteine cluster protein [Deltaproteobacteria bacterium]|nr:MAG: YkgJ family cysteine cluster protein [Deltaproteobacteria bacterium]